MLPGQVLFEFTRGAYRRGVSEPARREFLGGFARLPVSEAQVLRAAQIDAALATQGLSIGSAEADVWIAAAALEEKLPVLTTNVGHFSRVPGVQVIGYSILL